MPLSNISTANFTFNYNKRVNQTKVLAKRRDIFLRTLTITRELCLLYSASRASTTLK